MIKNKFKKLINKLLSAINLKIIKLNVFDPHDFTNIKINPLTAQYLSGYRPMVINISLKNGRTSNWFEMSDESLDPAIFAIKNALKKDLEGEDLYKDILNTLKENHSLMKCKNASHSLNIESNDDEDIKKYPWWAIVHPWDDYTFEDKIKNYPYDIKRNREKNGMHIASSDPNIIIKENYENSWPSHAKQYVNLINKIKEHGFQYGSEYGYVSAEIFIEKNKLCWKPGAEGNHRMAVAAALGFKNIPVLVTKIIRLDELEYWPNVVKGLFSKDQAKKIFFDIFNAKPQKINEDWVKKLLNKN
ncbi:hypothetical protein N9L10_01180 [Candidatus Pelagibacter bacterium]|jgi:hypothetical protein|nr:hypothetical protein [Candidatus Pelagibacter bacterium]